MKTRPITLFVPALGLILGACGSAPFNANPLSVSAPVSTKTIDLTQAEVETWGAADLFTDTIAGMSVNKAYAELLVGRKSQSVIVGVIDSGVDIEHEDLKEVIWVNTDEIPGNGIDDDNNGYVDDIHGWNFLGDIVQENLEYVRIMRDLAPEFDGKDAASVSDNDQGRYQLYLKAKGDYQKDHAEAVSNKERYQGMHDGLREGHAFATEALGKEDYTAADLAGLTGLEDGQQALVDGLNRMLGFAPTIPAVMTRLMGGVDYFSARLESHFNSAGNYRANNLGDDADDFSSKYYGNNDVDGPDPKKEDARHGTHVAGIIAAKRNNGIGMDGVADNAQIMVVRTVPDGDEYDKDVALAIRYCVDNGAKVLNTSFGKGYSPHPEWVWDAIQYASDNDVLIVNAAGNDGMNLDENITYPTDLRPGETQEIGNTFITIGASGPSYDEALVANFSNYGKNNVDLFSPGVKIWSTTPLNTYEYLQGTSMAAPAVAGVAAVIRSYFPKLSAEQVKQILMDSGLSGPDRVVLGGDPSNADRFDNISKSGRLVNLYNALIMAEQRSR
jgi:cell wall-associated protease